MPIAVEGRSLPRKMDETSCAKCERTFTARKNYYRHLRNFHPDDKIQYDSAKMVVCPLCDEKYPTMTALQNHICMEHDIQLNFEELTFYSEKDFESWKLQIEEQTCSQFIKHSGKKESSDGEKNYFYCNRSGFFKSKTERKRGSKSSRTIKFGKSCPATIVVLRNDVDNVVEIKVNYQSRHVGHDAKIGNVGKHVRLVCRNLKENLIETDNLIICESNKDVEKEILEKQLVVKKNSDDVENQRTKTITLLIHMLEKCKSPNMTSEQLKIISNSLKEINKKLTVTGNANVMKKDYIQNYKRKIDKQKRFPSKRSKHE